MGTAFVKVLAALIAIAALVLVLGLSGALFFLWPTSFPDQSLRITPEVLAELQALKDERKFVRDENTFYPGAPTEAVRASAQASVDAIIQSLVTELPPHPRRSVVLAKFKRALIGLEQHESEERDQALVYLHRIMSIVGVNNSGELLNVWRYGLPYGWFLRT